MNHDRCVMSCHGRTVVQKYNMTLPLSWKQLKVVVSVMLQFCVSLLVCMMNKWFIPLQKADFQLEMINDQVIMQMNPSGEILPLRTNCHSLSALVLSPDYPFSLFVCLQL